MQALAGLLLAAAISYGAYRAGSLTGDGAVAAACLGTVVFAAGGWQAAVMLLAFFITSSLFSQLLRGENAPATDRYAKGARRDAGQVRGNGGIAGLWILAQAAFPESRLVWLGFAGALAAVTADTWATELGAFSRAAPRLITHLRRSVPPGTSGAVTILGTAAAAAGASALAVLAAALMPHSDALTVAAVAAGGMAGSLADSLLGASVQCLYFCPKDNIETEQFPVHRCGSATFRVRGWRWLNNDWVNAACGAVGSLVAVVVGLALRTG